MRQLETNRFDMLKRVDKFSKIYFYYIVTMKYGYKLFKDLNSIVPKLQKYFSQQASDTPIYSQSILKATARSALYFDLKMISNIVEAFDEEEFPDVIDQFYLPSRLTDQELIYTAHLFLERSEEIKAEFIRYEFDEDFQTQIRILIAIFEHAIATASTLPDNLAKTISYYDGLMTEALIIIFKLEIIMENKFGDGGTGENMDVLGDWIQASWVKYVDYSSMDLSSVSSQKA